MPASSAGDLCERPVQSGPIGFTILLLAGGSGPAAFTAFFESFGLESEISMVQAARDVRDQTAEDS